MLQKKTLQQCKLRTKYFTNDNNLPVIPDWSREMAQQNCTAEILTNWQVDKKRRQNTN